MNGLSQPAREALERSLQGLDLTRVVDCHAHLVGLGSAGSGAYVKKSWGQFWHPGDYLRFRFYLKASGVKDLSMADEQYEARLVELARARPWQGRIRLLAMDEWVAADGATAREHTHFHSPNEMAARAVERNPDLFALAASVHPFRKDALEQLGRWAARGAKVVKWLPNAMGFHPGEERLRPFYGAMKELGLTLLTHTGDEMAVPSRKAQYLGHPQHLKLPLDMGVRVIAAHCASLGKGKDLESGRKALNMSLLFEMMGEKKWEGLLYADLSAILQVNRTHAVWLLAAHPELSNRLIQGSDYPLPCINPLTWLFPFRVWGMLSPRECAGLREIFKLNPLVFDLCAKRLLKNPENGRPLLAGASFQEPGFL